MWIRKVPPGVIVRALITAIKAGLKVTSTDLETHYLAGGDVSNVINAMISAEKANIVLDFKQATAIDLAGRDVLGAVRMSVTPRVITYSQDISRGSRWHSTSLRCKDNG